MTSFHYANHPLRVSEISFIAASSRWSRHEFVAICNEKYLLAAVITLRPSTMVLAPRLAAAKFATTPALYLGIVQQLFRAPWLSGGHSRTFLLKSIVSGMFLLAYVFIFQKELILINLISWNQYNPYFDPQQKIELIFLFSRFFFLFDSFVLVLWEDSGRFESFSRIY